MKLRIEYRHDPESHNWCFTVPSLGIVGGAETRQGAEERAVEAIEFTLESENESTSVTDGEVGYLEVSVNR